VVRLVPIVTLVVLGLLLIALVLPSKGDTTLAAWWARMRRDVDLFIRSVIALASLAAIVWIVLRLFGSSRP